MQSKWISLIYFMKIEKTEELKMFRLSDHHNHDLVMLHLVGKLFSKLEHIKFLVQLFYHVSILRVL